MKTQLSRAENFIFAFLIIVTVFSCKKEEITTRLNDAEKSAATESTSFQTDGIITVEASILPPATRETFITSGSSSKAVFQILSSQVVTLENVYFAGPYPLIQYLTAKNIGVAVNHESGQMGLIGVGTVDENGLKLVLDVFYNTVDVNTSGSVARLDLTSIQYKTHDGIYRTFNLPKVISALPVSIVNNVPHILLMNPDNDTLQNGYKQIIKIKLTGDTAWKLKKLPLNLWSPYIRTISESQLIVKYKGDEIAYSDSLQLNGNSRVETIINFGNGFKHVAGETEILKIYANSPHLAKKGNTIFTIIYPLKALVWADGLGANIPGSSNRLFFKEETGDATYDEY
jgi:hypothetical protein